MKTVTALAATLALLLAPPAPAQVPTPMQQAEAAFERGHGREALLLWQLALQQARQAGDLAAQLQALGRMGETAALIGEHRQATAWLAQALELARSQRNEAALARWLPQLADSAWRAADIERSVAANRELAARAEAAAQWPTAALAQVRLGQSLLQTDPVPAAAVPALQRAVALFRQLGDDERAVRATVLLGEALRRQERYLDAVQTYREAAAAAQSIGHTAVLAQALRGEGTTLALLGDHTTAVNVLREALRQARRAGDREVETGALMSLGNAQYFLARHDDAAQSYAQVLNSAEARGDQVLESQAAGNLGLVLASLGQHERAQALLQRDATLSRERGDRRSEAQALGNLATQLMNRQQYEPALAPLQRSAALAREIGYRRGEAIALRNLGLAQLKTGQAPAAESSLRQALTVHEALRNGTRADDRFNLTLAESQRDIHRHLQAALVAQDKPEAALLVSEQGRAQALRDLLARAGSDIVAPAPAGDELARWKALARARGLTVVEWSFVPADAAIYTWLLQPDGQLHFVRQRVESRQGGNVDDAVDDLVRRTRVALRALGPRDAPAATDAETADMLLATWHRLLVAPVAHWLPTTPDAPVLLVPQGSLFQLPLAALRDEGGRTLAERHTLFTAPSIHTLLQLQERRPGRGEGAVVLGNPTLGTMALSAGGGSPATFAPLPAAEREARAVAALWRSEPLLGAAATRAAVLHRAPRARTIHLATHGVADDVRGQGVPGALALARSADGDSDGWLASSDIVKLPLLADLVVLSACQTGLGQISGDGVLGLARSFLAAGARSTVVSLWAVPDQPTAELMQDFHRRLAAGAGAAQALRQAMLALRLRHPDPLAWAGFVIVGDPL